MRPVRETGLWMTKLAHINGQIVVNHCQSPAHCQSCWYLSHSHAAYISLCCLASQCLCFYCSKLGRFGFPNLFYTIYWLVSILTLIVLFWPLPLFYLSYFLTNSRFQWFIAWQTPPWQLSECVPATAGHYWAPHHCTPQHRGHWQGKYEDLIFFFNSISLYISLENF